MRLFLILTLFLFNNFLQSQSINLNETQIIDYLRNQQLLGNFDDKVSFSIRPIHIDKKINDLINLYSKPKKKEIYFRLLPVNFNSEYSSHHPYNRNNGSMIPARGYQQLVSLGGFLKLGPLEIQIKPENIFAENKIYDGFWEGHYPIIISRRLNKWNRIDTPEMFGQEEFKKTYLGQSSIKLNFKNISFGYSNENIWWGPSIRNSIMMSNHAKGFEHITLNSNKPIKTRIGSFEFQMVTGKLINSNFDQSYSNYKYANHLTFVKKSDDWRYFQAINFIFSPKILPGLSLGLIRWIQSYYSFVKKNNDYFPIFDNLFRKNDKYGYQSDSQETERDQAAGVFLRWLFVDSKAEIYAEFHYNDSKGNFRDLLLDSDHSRANSLGFQKIFHRSDNDYYKIFWEWTQMEQSASRVLRNAGSWYTHHSITHGYTNRGEVIGSSIGPGSNSHYFGISKQKNDNNFGLFLEIIDNDNDFLYTAFEEAKDYRRYWKDYNIHLTFKKKFKSTWMQLNLMYSRSLNYQWGLDDAEEGVGYEWYLPGIDVNNFYFNFKVIYPIKF
jgi:hypothetical protein